ncbi:MAG: DegT/DnrJ/EryC1/StrS family aminotransferase [Hyphomicrobiaceae bacterium]
MQDTPQPPFLPFAKPAIGEEEIAAVVETLRSGWLTTGPATRAFEQEFAEFVGADHAVAVNSATAGLHLALEAIGIGPGDKVLTTPYTFTATAEVVRYLGATPIFVDVVPDTFNIDPVKLEQVASEHPEAKAIIPVHFAGQSCDMTPILEIARQHSLRVIEDAAHALPTTYEGQLIGGIGDVTVFSFYATKTITTGEGGMAVTACEKIAKRMQTMRLHGISRDVFDRYTSDKATWYYEVVAPGYKYNMTDMAASIGRCQLRKALQFQGEREAIAKTYSQAFADLPVICPKNCASGDVHAWHLYVLRLDVDRLTIARDAFIEQMRQAGIGTSVHFIPLHLQPFWRDEYSLKPHDFPIALDIYNRCVSLPIWPGMTEAEIERVISAVSAILSKATV